MGTVPLDNMAITGLSRLLHLETASVSAQFCGETWVQRMLVLSGQEIQFTGRGERLATLCRLQRAVGLPRPESLFLWTLSTMFTLVGL